jgi:hypothetical protein
MVTTVGTTTVFYPWVTGVPFFNIQILAIKFVGEDQLPVRRIGKSY